MKSTPDKPLPLTLPAAPALLQKEPNNLPTDELVLSSSEMVDLMRQVLSKGRPFQFRARGGSMAPFIQDGDTICVTPFKRNEPRLGDVAAFIHPQTGQLVVHRVVGRNGLTYLIKGDNTYANPDVVSQKYLLGKVTQVERNGRQNSRGLGPERYLIALSSRAGLLFPVLRRTGSIMRMLFRKLV